MPDRFYGGFRAGRTQASLAVLLRRDDTNKGKTGVAPPGATPSFVNGVTAGDTGTSTPTVFVFTPGAGAAYSVLRYNVRADVRPSSIACVPTGGGTTVNLAEIGAKYRSTVAGVTLGGWGGALLANQEYTITVTWEASNSNAVVWIGAYANVASVGTPAGAEHSGGASPSIPPLLVNTGGGTALCIDIGGAIGGSTAMSPNSGQTAESAMVQDGASQAYLRPSWKVGAGAVAMTWSITGPGTGAAWGVALLGPTGTTMSAAYVRQGASPVDIPLVPLANPSAAWASGGWVELDAVKTPGLYRLDLPDAAVAAGADWVAVEVVVAGAFEYAERLGLETRRALRRGVAYPGLTFFLQRASDGLALTGATVTPARFLDGGSSAPMTNAVVEKSGGVYAIDLSTADSDALFGCYLFTAPGAIPRAVLLIFEP